MTNPFTLTPDEMLAGIERAGRKGVFVIDAWIYDGNKANLDQLRREGKVALIDADPKDNPESIDRAAFTAQYVREFKDLALIYEAPAEDTSCDYYWRA
jgi:hypothetical protein